MTKILKIIKYLLSLIGTIAIIFFCLAGYHSLKEWSAPDKKKYVRPEPTPIRKGEKIILILDQIVDQRDDFCNYLFKVENYTSLNGVKLSMVIEQLGTDGMIIGQGDLIVSDGLKTNSISNGYMYAKNCSKVKSLKLQGISTYEHLHFTQREDIPMEVKSNVNLLMRLN